MHAVTAHLATALIFAMASGPAEAAGKRTPPRKPTCERASYPGDPVCDVGEDAGTLPTPASRRIRRASDSSGFLVGDDVSIDGKTTFNENRFGEAPLQKFKPRPSAKENTSGGAQVDFRF